jgi:GT2 family glycosyltransferase
LQRERNSAVNIPLVYIVILNWNGWYDTLECLSSIRDLTYQNYRVVVLDNGSEDDSCQRIRDWAKGESVSGKVTENKVISDTVVTIVEYDKTIAEAGGNPHDERLIRELSKTESLVLIKNGENLGFAAGNNVGIRYALASAADYVWLLNNDTTVEPNSLSKLVNFLENNSDYQGATGQIRFYHNRSMVWNCGGSLSIYGTRKYDYAGADISKTPQSGAKQVTFITGCAFLLRASLLRKSGLLSEKFFFGEEDIEYCYRLKNRGEKIACVYDSIIYHKVSSSTRGVDVRVRIGKVYIHYLNRFIHMRGQFPYLIWLIWRLVALIYIIPMLKIKYDFRWSLLTDLIMKLLKDSSSLDRISRSTFIAAMKEKDWPLRTKLDI